ncbi:DUS11 phosphatase, partial [Atractosteus spatula]|nr:DUS11 phosphatase [Atractosteus spatula]
MLLLRKLGVAGVDGNGSSFGNLYSSSAGTRWTNYQALGKRIPGTRFIAFKVPLKRSFESRLQPSQYFGPFDLVQRLQEENQELGLIIDLTFTTRYYKPEDLPESLHYVKIFTAGHEVPSDKTILSFKRAVNKFLQENEHNDKLIGVHCTHGLNRTGYLVCRYLIDVDGVNPKKAMQLFNKSRGHSIERENYIEDLRHGPKRSNAGMEVAEQEPVRGSASQVQSVTPFSRPAPHCGRESLLGPYKSCRPPYPPSGIQRDQPYPPFLPRPPPSRGMRPPGAPRQPFRQDWRGPADSYRSALPVFHHCAGSSGTNGPRPGTSMNGQQPPPHTGSLEEPRRTKKKAYWRARKKERRNPK